MGVLAPGAVLGGCRIDAVVGRGGMGVVYRARQLNLDRDVAVKVIAPELVEDPQSRKRFLTEARAAGAIEHPNVVPVHGAGVADGQAYLVMRYIAGDDLRTLVRRDGAFTARRAADVARQLGDALDAIHRAGYVHRDVKPQNVMVDDAGHVYLSDFGLAKHALGSSGPTRSEQWVGTVDYVAPEQIRGEPVDARADVYALGGVLYFMLTGHVPFERDGDHAKIWAHLVDAPPRPSAMRPELPTEIDAVVQRALAKDREERQPSAGDLARAAGAAARGVVDPRPERMVARGAAATGTTAEARSGTLPRPVGRRRWPALAAVVATSVAGVVAFVLLNDSDRGERAARSPGQGGAPTPSAAPDPTSVSVGATFKPVGFRSRGLAVVGRRVWVISYQRERITTVDAATGDRRGPQPVVGRGASSIAADDDAVWVTLPSRSTVVGVSPRSGEIVREIPTPLPPARVAVGRSGLWVVARKTADGPAVLLRYDRDGAQLLQQTDVAHGIAAITLGGGYAWLALVQERRVLRIAPGGGLQNGARLTAPATALAFGAGYLWASVPEDDSVSRIDPRSKLAKTTAVGRHPAQLVVAKQRVFVASNTSHRILVLDPKTGRRVGKPLRVPPNPAGVAAGGGHVWVTGVAASTLTRLDL
jgi:predicted Ser/Thr protein kinase